MDYFLIDFTACAMVVIIISYNKDRLILLLLNNHFRLKKFFVASFLGENFPSLLHKLDVEAVSFPHNFTARWFRLLLIPPLFSP